MMNIYQRCKDYGRGHGYYIGYNGNGSIREYGNCINSNEIGFTCYLYIGIGSYCYTVYDSNLNIVSHFEINCLINNIDVIKEYRYEF